MGKEILTFVYIEIERKKITAVRLQFFLKDVDIEKVLVSKKISFGEKTMNTLLVTCMRIIKSHHFI